MFSLVHVHNPSFKQLCFAFMFTQFSFSPNKSNSCMIEFFLLLLCCSWLSERDDFHSVNIRLLLSTKPCISGLFLLVIQWYFLAFQTSIGVLRSRTDIVIVAIVLTITFNCSDLANIHFEAVPALDIGHLGRHLLCHQLLRDTERRLWTDCRRTLSWGITLIVRITYE